MIQVLTTHPKGKGYGDYLCPSFILENPLLTSPHYHEINIAQAVITVAEDMRITLHDADAHGYGPLREDLLKDRSPPS